MKSISFMIIICILTAASAIADTTTGGLIGKTLSEDGTELTGVTVTARSPSLQGQKTALTGVNGNYRLILLPPGVYTLRYSLSGFETLTEKDVLVSLGTTYTLNAVLKPLKLKESITVTSEQHLIDFTSTASGNNWTIDYFESIPVQRTIGSVLTITPGITRAEGPSGGVVISGASGTESSYVIDGMNTTNIEFGVMGKQLNFDFIEEIQVKTGGYEAEYGRSTGGVVNMITKGGSNEFHGSVFYYFRNQSFFADRKTPWFGTSLIGSDESDYGFSLGGPIIKDKLWFFIAFNPSQYKEFYNNNEGVSFLRHSSTSRNKTENDYWSIKLTYSFNENHTLVFSAFADPQKLLDANDGEESTDRIKETGGTDWIIKYDGFFNNNFVLSIQAGSHEEKKNIYSVDGQDIPLIASYYQSSLFGYRGGIFRQYNDKKIRDILKISGEFFWNGHDIKSGIDLETLTFNAKTRYSGGEAIFYDDLGDYIYITRYMYASPDSNGNLWDLGDDENRYQQLIDGYQHKDTETVNYSLFLQDKWNVSDTLLLTFGYRLESQKNKGNFPEKGGKFTALDFKNMDALRIGFTWDVFGNGNSKLYGHFGEFYNSLPMDMNNRIFAREVQLFDLWLKPKLDMDVNNDGAIDFYDFNPELYNLNYSDSNLPIINFLYLSGEPFPVADNLKGMSHDETVFGIDTLLNNKWSVGFKFTYRTLNNIIEDFSLGSGSYWVIGNPGNDLSFTALDDMNFIDSTGIERNYSAGDAVELTADQLGFPDPKRNYRAYEFSLKKQFADNWTMHFSVVYSKLWGNYIGGELPYYNQVNPGMTMAYDNPLTFTNVDGYPLAYDRPWQIKWNGIYQFNSGLSIGWHYSYMSGTPVAAYGLSKRDSDGYNGEFRMIGNGVAGRTPQVQYLDVNISYTVNLKNLGSLTGYFYIYNIFNFQNALQVNQIFTYDSPSDEYLAEHFDGDYDNYILWIDGAFDTYDELLTHAAEVGIEVNTHFMEGEQYQNPRYIRFGIKFKF